VNYLSGYFENFTFNDLFDILIVAFIVYRFLLIVQGTRAVQMLVGIAALATLYWGSLSYELYSLNWLLNHFFDYFFVILIILFQEQIRAALVSFGEARIFGKKKGALYDEQIEEVVAACSALSRERTGALIVFEKNHGLLNYSLTGTRLDAKIHSDILYSIFQSNSPLHDGAVIIFANRIQSAGCFLPLSKNVEIDRHLGTRHRAAIGISEVSDAVVIIVSEETGRMSITHDGKFYAMETETELRKNLRKLLLNNEIASKVELVNKEVVS
jgi:diadenylate cyclase